MNAGAAVQFTLPASFRKRGNWYISSCPSLDVHSQGKTRSEAEQNLVDALGSFLISCYERGTLDEVLRNAGFVPAPASHRTQPKQAARGVTVTVPLPFVIGSRRERFRASA
jgi:predicted RNase H-like HicB family nuclease